MWIGATHPEVFFYLHFPFMSALRGQFLSRVITNQPLCREHYKLVLGLPSFPQTDPGQFIQISCRNPQRDYEPANEFDWRPDARVECDADEFAGHVALLRRPFSLAGRREGNGTVELEIIHRVVGMGTDWMSRLTPGDSVDIIGPLGNRFTLPGAEQTALLVGGGVGIPPMIYLSQRLAGQRAVVFSGALSRDLLPLTIAQNVPAPSSDSVAPLLNIAEFSEHGHRTVISTDDGSYGFRGFITQALEKWLDSAALGAESQPLKPIVYTCGPEAMMKRVAQIAQQRSIECQIAVERAMACGMGTCQSCCIRVKKPDPAQPPLPGRDWCYRLACTDGPVFRGEDLLW